MKFYKNSKALQHSITKVFLMHWLSIKLIWSILKEEFVKVQHLYMAININAKFRMAEFLWFLGCETNRLLWRYGFDKQLHLLVPNIIALIEFVCCTTLNTKSFNNLREI